MRVTLNSGFKIPHFMFFLLASLAAKINKLHTFSMKTCW